MVQTHRHTSPGETNTTWKLLSLSLESPQLWKSSSTILIQKEKLNYNIDGWRPISLLKSNLDSLPKETLDLQKAFDSVNHQGLLEILKQFNFSNLKNTVQEMLNGITTSIKTETVKTNPPVYKPSCLRR